MSRPATLSLGVLAAVTLLTPVAEAQLVPHMLGPSGRAEHGCPDATPDGSMVAWDTDARTYVAGLDASGGPVGVRALPDRMICPVVGADAAGSAAVAGTSSGGEHLLIVRRGADGTFGAPARLGPINGESRVDSVAVGGGQVAVGYTDGRSGPGIALLRTDGAIVGPMTLPSPQRETQRAGPVVGLDATGRGLVLWVVAHERSSLRLLASTLAADGQLGPARVLAEDPVRADEDFSDIPGPEARVAVGPDGRAAAAWVADGKTVVVTGDTTAGIDLATATTAHVADVVAVQPDGAAIAAEGALGASETRIASRAAGRPFTRPRRFRGGGVEPALAVAIDRGRTQVVFELGDPRSALQRLFALSGVAGDVSGRPQPLRSAAWRVDPDQIAAALPGGTPTALTLLRYDTDRMGDRHMPTVFRPGGPSRRLRARVRIAPAQRSGNPPALRLQVRCPRECAMRIVGETPRAFGLGGGTFEALRRLPAGGTVPVRVPIPLARMPRGTRVQLQIGITDAIGELRLRRHVTVRAGPR